MGDDVVGIVAYGAYVPRLRLSRAAVVQANQWFAPGLKAHAKGERAMANWDEDAVTMAVEAARDALPGDRAHVAGVVLASTSAPFADRQNAGIVKEALNLRDDVLTQDVGGSQKAGTGALLRALQACAGGAGPTLCIASERSRARAGSEAELVNGDAAAAFLVGNGNPIARLVGSHSLALDFVDHFRGREAEYDYAWEARWTRDEGYVGIAGKAVHTLLARLGLHGEDIHRLLVAIPGTGVAEAVAKAARIPATAIPPGLGPVLGHAGAAQPLVMLAHALKTAQPGERLLLVGFGQGCDALLFETTAHLAAHAHPRGVDGWLARRKPETNYMKHLVFAGELELERGMRAEMEQKQPLTALYRSRKTVLGLVGTRSTKTGEVQFPRTPIAVDATGPGADDALEDYPFADRPARVLTFTADHLTYTPDPPSCYGMVEFEGGGRMLAEFTDVDPASLEVGLAMRMSFRIKAVDEKRAFTKYFWKAVPA